jgi:hypothetical protein
MAEEWFTETRARSLADVSNAVNPCVFDEGRGLYIEITYEIFRPSPGIMGILFTDRGYDGGARDWLGYTAFTFELATGRALAPFDLFPDREKGYGRLWEFIWNASCGQAPPRQSVPRYYGGMPCSGQATPPPPDGFLEDAETLEDLGSLVLTEQGASLYIDPSSAWSWAEGPYRLEIPAEELIGWGARPTLWQKADPTPPPALATADNG